MSAMPRRVPEDCKLLFGPYEPPPLRKGDRATCLYWDARVVVTSWSDGRISWPRCRALGHRGGSGLQVEEELARAITHESAAALMFWWGVTCSTAWLWRKVLGVEGNDGTEGSRRLILAAQRRAVEQLRRKRPPCVEPPRVACKRDRVRHLPAASRERAWPAEHLALLGTLTDAPVAARTGRCENGVRVKRSKLGIPNPSGPRPDCKGAGLAGDGAGRRGRGQDRADANGGDRQAVQARHPAPRGLGVAPGTACPAGDGPG
jgi:hypothetical protein